MFLNAGIYSLMRQSVNLDILIGTFVKTKSDKATRHELTSRSYLSLRRCFMGVSQLPGKGLNCMFWLLFALRQKKHENKLMCTFIEPVSNPIEDDPFLPRGRQPEGVTLHV